jgi:hypothetical protein
LSRTLDTLLKIRRDTDRRAQGPDPTEEAERPASESVVATYAEILFGPDGFGPGAEAAEPVDVPQPEPAAGSGDGAREGEIPQPSPAGPIPQAEVADRHAERPATDAPRWQDATPEPAPAPSPAPLFARLQNEATDPHGRGANRTEIDHPQGEPVLASPLRGLPAARPTRGSEGERPFDAEARDAGHVEPGSRPDPDRAGRDRFGPGRRDDGDDKDWAPLSRLAPARAGSFPTNLSAEPTPAAQPP